MPSHLLLYPARMRKEGCVLVREAIRGKIIRYTNKKYAVELEFQLSVCKYVRVYSPHIRTLFAHLEHSPTTDR